jgi:hypothetical protein
MLLKGYGNAIVPQVAAEFIKAFEASIKDPANDTGRNEVFGSND